MSDYQKAKDKFKHSRSIPDGFAMADAADQEIENWKEKDAVIQRLREAGEAVIKHPYEVSCGVNPESDKCYLVDHISFEALQKALKEDK